MSVTVPKLTKKQKKALAFRERKRGGKATGSTDAQDENDSDADNAVPVSENQDVAEVEDRDVDRAQAAQGSESRGAGKAKIKGNGKATEEDEEARKGDAAEARTAESKSKKRKRQTEETRSEAGEERRQEGKRKKRKGGVDGDEPIRDEAAERSGAAKEVKDAGKQRFILFVGNLKYSTTKETIQQHFSACDPPPTVRLLTPKVNAQKPTSSKSKGCAFLEFSHRNALQQGLKLHQSELDGRRINVELTAGGGGKSEKRLGKVRERNKGLADQRKQRLQKQKPTLKHKGSSEGGDDGDAEAPMRPQRYSTTSGIEQENAGKRTWTVGDVVDEETHRGGKKHVRGKKKGAVKSKDWGTGVNSIPVG